MEELGKAGVIVFTLFKLFFEKDVYNFESIFNLRFNNKSGQQVLTTTFSYNNHVFLTNNHVVHDKTFFIMYYSILNILHKGKF